jgi:hypothetical protein
VSIGQPQPTPVAQSSRGVSSGRSAHSTAAQMSGVAHAHDRGTQDYAGPMSAFLATQQVSLEPVDAAEVTILVDNEIDIFAANTPIATRQALAYVGAGQRRDSPLTRSTSPRLAMFLHGQVALQPLRQLARA